ncbi:unnamed protein product, partial [marine sediment metagenome]
IVLDGVVGSGQDDGPGQVFPGYDKLGGRCGYQVGEDNRSTGLLHRPGRSLKELPAVRPAVSGQEYRSRWLQSGKSAGVAMDNRGIQVRSHYAANTGNGADQCHDIIPVRTPDFKPAG